MALLCAEDRRVWTYVYNDMLKVLIPIAYRTTYDLATAKDLVHDCLAEVCLQLRKSPLHTYQEFRAYCVRCMLNICCNYRSKSKLRKEKYAYYSQAIEWNSEAVMADKRFLQQVFFSLSPKAQRILKMYYQEHRNLKDIASQFLMSESQVKRIHAGFQHRLDELKLVV